MLAIWHDVAAGSEAAVSHWYNTEHHPERLSVPGFLEACRYRLAGGEGRQFMSLYRTRDPGVLASPGYRARLESPTPRTREIMPLYQNMSRTVCRIALSLGSAQGGCMAVLAGNDTLPDARIGDVLPELSQLPGVLRCRWLRSEVSPSGGPGTIESALRPGGDGSLAWAALIDTNEVDEARDSLDRLEKALAPKLILQSAVYRLVYAGGAA
ncbi:MAG: hypothetical protein ACREVQ_13885 [Burkholderiales bacterium]